MAETMFDFIKAQPVTPDMSGAIQNALQSKLFENTTKIAEGTMESIHSIAKPFAEAEKEKEKKLLALQEERQKLIDSNKADSDFAKQLTIYDGLPTEQKVPYLEKGAATLLDSFTKGQISPTYFKTYSNKIDTLYAPAIEAQTKQYQETTSIAAMPIFKENLTSANPIPMDSLVRSVSSQFNVPEALLQQTAVMSQAEVYKDKLQALLAKPGVTLQDIDKLTTEFKILHSSFNSQYFTGNTSEKFSSIVQGLETTIDTAAKNAKDTIEYNLKSKIAAFTGDTDNPGSSYVAKTDGISSITFEDAKKATVQLYWNDPVTLNSKLNELTKNTKDAQKTREVINNFVNNPNAFNQAAVLGDPKAKEIITKQATDKLFTAMTTGNYQGFMDIFNGAGMIVKGAASSIYTQAMISNDPTTIKAAVGFISNLAKYKNGASVGVAAFGAESFRDAIALDALSKTGFHSQSSIVELKDAISNLKAQGLKNIPNNIYNTKAYQDMKTSLGDQYNNFEYVLKLAETANQLTPTFVESVYEKYKTLQDNTTYGTSIYGTGVYKANPAIAPEIGAVLKSTRAFVSNSLGLKDADVRYETIDSQNVRIKVGGVPYSVVLNLPEMEKNLIDYKRITATKVSNRDLSFALNDILEKYTTFVGANFHDSTNMTPEERGAKIRNYIINKEQGKPTLGMDAAVSNADKAFYKFLDNTYTNMNAGVKGVFTNLVNRGRLTLDEAQKLSAYFSMHRGQEAEDLIKASKYGTGSRGIKVPLTIRFNNPGAIYMNSSNSGLQGVNRTVPVNGKQFIHFNTPEAGIRAQVLDLGSKIKKGTTLEQLLYTYAPPHENNTEAYINSVSNDTKFSRYRRLNLNDIPALARAMITVEGTPEARKYFAPHFNQGLQLGMEALRK